MPAVTTISVRTQRRSQMVEITDEVARLCDDIESGYVIVYVPHTTAGVTIQENADPDVQHDLLRKLDELVPKKESYYRHSEGNSDSHLKTAMVGNSVTVLIEAGRMLLGQWQGIYLCEFDGPRTREVMVKRVKA
ncbi:secondary thiamine-phosphate synthase enzyme YjbQ [Humisphaera borealis]|uniref:YjbQ family protein n=1 Tax=Humisphaera borealis TaxID=2807512 RepID=A0A7M2X373_9BACT|nr:secondary thiamine-phosphate synthase enzyme YjbQ [Humisphaera borealis]QOV92124.1 YjbQ family protein [Humisphaera borealis]